MGRTRGRNAKGSGAALVVLGGILVAPPAGAERWIGLEVGTSDTRIQDARRFNLSARWSFAQWSIGRWGLVPFWELTAGAIRARDGLRKGRLQLNEGGFRLLVQARHLPGGRFFLEAGTGPMLLSATQIADLDLGSKLQFRSYAGLGVRLGAERRWELAYRYSHTSNANLGTPNPGINFQSIRLGYAY